MARLVVTVNDEAVLARMRAMIARGENPRPVLERVGDDFLDMERRQFASSGAAGGTPWVPLSAEWQARKRGGGGTLVGPRARMERSLVTRGARGGKRRITRRSITMGTTHPLAHLHQGGTGQRYVRTYRGQPLAQPRSAGSLPARPVVAVTPGDEQRWRGFLVDYLVDSGRTLGL